MGFIRGSLSALGAVSAMAVVSFARAGAPCAWDQQTIGNLRISNNPDCSLAVEAISDADAGRYRAYTFQPNGGLMVFIATTDSKRLSQATGSRSFFLFPRKLGSKAGVRASSADAVTVVGPAGQIAAFSTTTGQLVSLEGYRVRVADEISRFNRGGVELRAESGRVLVDTDWRLGGTGYDPIRRDALSTVAGAGAGAKACRPKNRELFAYAGGEASFRFADDRAFAAFLARKCPGTRF